ncbi:MAG: hypothetical protein ACO20H_00305 [Bacteriovoracaceae bacterium]
MIKRKKKSQQGQSTTEFLSSFIFAIVIVIVFLKISFVIADGFLVHYATYMASRTYLVVDINANSPGGSDAASFQRSAQTFLSFLVPRLVPNWVANLQVNSPRNVDNKVFVGNWIEFRNQFGVSDIVGGKKPVYLRSESFLGKEPTVGECIERVCAAMDTVSGGADCTKYTTLFDNGC